MKGDAAKKADSRPTVIPSFDVGAFARAQAASDGASEVRVRPEQPVAFPEVATFEPEPSSALIRRALGPPESVPYLLHSTQETLARVTDAKSAFVVGFIDGLLPIDVLIEAVGFSCTEVVAIVGVLVDAGLVALREPPPA